MKNSILYQKLVSYENIYRAIYSLESYVFEKNLLSVNDLKKFLELKDKFNMKEIDKVINKVKTVIDKVILGNDLFDIEVYLRFKSKKVDSEIEFRPIHTSTLINQIAMVSMLNLIIYDYIDSDGTNLSNISKLIPNNFYGNIPSIDPKYLFCKWQDMYKKYSSDINNSYFEYYNNKKYKYEVCLDLKNFFPSINPLIIYKYITSKFPVYIKGEELQLLKKIVFKLLYFNVNNAKNIEDLYYHDKQCKEYYSVGLPQGLPQSYFFGNICMIEISNIFNEIFEGDSYYYVDDSVIFTNSLDENDKENGFCKKLDLINKEIQNRLCINSNELDNLNFIDKDLVKHIKIFEKKQNYDIKVHMDNKSQYNDIKKENSGERYLNILNREASMSSIQINSILDDQDQSIVISRLKAFNEIIEKELEIINNESDKESYRKKLIRFKKYFKFRLHLFKFKKNYNEYELIEDLIKELSFEKENIKNNEGFEKFIKYYDEDIFMSSFNFVINNMKDNFKLKKLSDAIKKFELYILNNRDQKLYFSKSINTIINLNKDINNINIEYSYNSLKKYAYKNIPDFRNVSDEKKVQWINKYLINFQYTEINYLDKLCELIFKNSKVNKYFSLIDKMSFNIKRMLLNCIFSKLFSVEISDKKIIQKSNNKIINVIEFRILMYLRNSKFDYNEFIILLKNNNLQEIRKLDFSIYEVIDYFFKYIKNPILIDKLINIHQFTSEYWKNGSKYLYFYTQHNQEHATNLINNCIRVINSIGYFKISYRDYYLTFCSCYLHDISMVLYPDKNKILYEEDVKYNMSINNLKENILKFNEKNELDLEKWKSIFLEINKELENIFESKIRSSHGNKSAEFIRSSSELNFLEFSDREIIAEISEAHIYNPREIYNLKSIAQKSLLSKKFDKVILRLSDILDIGEERISNVFLKNNINNMNEESQFQWLSHYLILGYFIDTKYNIDKQKTSSSSLDSYLKNRSIQENIVININVRYNQLMKVEKIHKCNKSRLSKVCKEYIEIKIGDTICDCQEECNFMCKWIHIKNEYMFEEFYELQKYLLNTTDNYFKTNITIKVNMKDSLIDNKYIDIINKYISK